MMVKRRAKFFMVNVVSIICALTLLDNYLAKSAGG